MELNLGDPPFQSNDPRAPNSTHDEVGPLDSRSLLPASAPAVAQT